MTDSATDNRTTELLRKMLEERGVNYTIDDSVKGDLITVSIEPKRRVYIEVRSRGGMAIWGGAITPEQAIAATLGSGECEFVGGNEPPKCSACGWQTSIYDCDWFDDNEYEYDGAYCKQCGAKVKAVRR